MREFKCVVERGVVALFCFLVLLNPGYGVQPVRLVVDDYGAFLKGDVEGVRVGVPGHLERGVMFRELGDDAGGVFGERHIWDVVWDGRGKRFIAGTGSGGEVVALDPRSGEVEVLATFEEGEVYAVAVREGEIYAATSPKGRVYRLSRKAGEEAEVYFEHHEEYVWDMVFDEKGDLYVATGSEGKIYRVRGAENGEVFYDSDEGTIRCLAFSPENVLYAGSSGSGSHGGGGILYRVERQGRFGVGRALLKAEKPEVLAIEFDDEGGMYAVTIGKRSFVTQTIAPPKSKDKEVGKAEGVVTVSVAEGEKHGAEKNASQVAPPQVTRKTVLQGGKGATVYYVNERDYPKVIWRGKDHVYSAYWYEDELLLGVGSEGKVYGVREDGRGRFWGKVSGKQITALGSSNEGGELYVFSSNMGRAFRAGDPIRGEARYRSHVVDSKVFSQWGNIRILGDGKWHLRSRSGNTPEPDQSWYEWRNVERGGISSENARYMQFEVELIRGRVDRVELFYLPENQPPFLKQVMVLEPGVGYEVLAPRKVVDQPMTSEQVLKTKGKVLQTVSANRYRKVNAAGLRTLVWAGGDVNRDRLVYEVSVRMRGEEEWSVLKKDYQESLYSWDTMGWVEGIYEARIRVSDHESNAEGFGLEGVRYSEPWMVDHTVPVISGVKRSGERLVFRVRDEVSFIRSVGVSRDGVHYDMVVPSDGVLDGKDEYFEVEWDASIKQIRVEDMSGNVGGYRFP